MKHFYKLMQVENSLKEEYLQTKELYQDIGSLPSLEVREQIRRLYAKEPLNHSSTSPWVRIAGIAALFIGLLFISALFFNASNIGVTDPPLEKEPLNHRLETLMKSHFRGHEKTVIVPQQDVITHSGEVLTFDGHHKPFQGMTISLYTVKDDQIKQYPYSTTRMFIPVPELTGTYYWVLETPEKIIEVGRFYVQ